MGRISSNIIIIALMKEEMAFKFQIACLKKLYTLVP